MKPNILVTGASGFIGSNLTKKLISQNFRVKVLVRSKSKLIKRKIKGRIEVIEGDLTKKESLNSAVKGVDLIFNTAALLPYHNLTPKDYWRVNVLGVENLINACLNHRVNKLIHLSTIGVFGSTGDKVLDERAPLNLTDPYSITKAEGDKIVRSASKKGLKTVIIRPTIAYGPGDIRPVILSLFSLIKKGLFIPIGKGENYFHTIYIDNLIDGLMLASKKDQGIGEDFIIGDEPCPRFKDLVNEISKVSHVKVRKLYIPKEIAYLLGKVGDLGGSIGMNLPLTTQRVKFVTENKKFKIDKAKKFLAYKPKVKLDEGVNITYSWYKENQYL